MKIKISIILVLLAFISCSKKSDFQLLSPNGALQVNVSNFNNSSIFTVINGSDTILESSIIGLKINGISFVENVSFSDLKTKSLQKRKRLMKPGKP